MVKKDEPRWLVPKSQRTNEEKKNIDKASPKKAGVKGSGRRPPSPRTAKAPKVLADNKLIAQDELNFIITAHYSNIAPIEARIERLNRYPELTSETLAIAMLARAHKELKIDYVKDWELRARLAELELCAISIDLDNAPGDTVTKNSSIGGKVKAKNLAEKMGKSETRQMWLDWQNGKYRYRSTAEFINDVQRKLLNADGWAKVKDGETIRRWIKEWERESS